MIILPPVELLKGDGAIPQGDRSWMDRLVG